MAEGAAEAGEADAGGEATRTPRWVWWWWGGLALVYALLIVPTWGDAYLDFGDGNYLYVARRVREGVTLYRDVLSPQPPLHTVVAAAMLAVGEALLGRDLWGVRAYSLLLHVGTAALLMAFAGMVTAPYLDRRARGVAMVATAALYLTIPISFWWTRGYQTHPTLVAFMVGSAMLVLRDRVGAAAGAGALAGLGLMTSMTAVPYVALMGGWLIVRRWRQGLAFGAACAAVALAIGGWYEATTGYYLENVVRNQAGSFPREEILGRPLLSYVVMKWLTQGGKVIAFEAAYLVAAVAGLVWWLGRAMPTRHPHGVFLAMMTIAWWGSIAFVAKGATADYIFSLGEPWVCLWGGAAIGAIVSAVCARRAAGGRAFAGRHAAGGAALGLLLLFAIARTVLFHVEVLRGEQDELDAGNVARVVALIERYSKPGDEILAPPFYAFISGRRVAGEYAEIFLWTIKYWNERVLPEHRDAPPGDGIAKVEALAARLRARAIPFVILDLAQTGRIPEIAEAIDAHYCPLFGATSTTMNTPLQFYVPRPDGVDCASLLLAPTGPLR